MTNHPSQCAECRNWFDLRGSIVPEPQPKPEIISHGLCLDCYVAKTAAFRPTTVLGWMQDHQTMADEIVKGLARL